MTVAVASDQNFSDNDTQKRPSDHQNAKVRRLLVADVGIACGGADILVAASLPSPRLRIHLW